MTRYRSSDEYDSLLLLANQPHLDRLFDALTSRYRRYTLLYLFETETARLDELASAIQTHDPDSRQSRDRIVSVLHHCHLPKLASDGFVRYSPEESTVELTTDMDEKIVELLAVAAADEAHPDEWLRHGLEETGEDGD